MYFAFTPEQEQLRLAVRKLLADRSPLSATRALLDSADGFDRDVWRHFADSLGVCGLGVPESYGGVAHGFVEITAVFEELGYGLFSSPYLASVLTAQCLVRCLEASTSDGHCGEYLTELASGRLLATVALRGELAVDESGPVPRLTGRLEQVLDGSSADLIIVPGRTSSGRPLYAVPSSAAGLVRTPLPTIDRTRRLARLDFVDVSAELLVGGRAGVAVLDWVTDLAGVALSAEAVGSMSRLLELAVDYAKTRTQFDRPIGSFQAIKHRCANMLLDLESARALAEYAGWAAAHCPDQLPVAASMAQSFTGTAFCRSAESTIQVLGGIGFTWEHDAQLFLKRAQGSRLLLGSPGQHRAQLADRLGL